jgi:hypothetical protein
MSIHHHHVNIPLSPAKQAVINIKVPLTKIEKLKYNAQNAGCMYCFSHKIRSKFHEMHNFHQSGPMHPIISDVTAKNNVLFLPTSKQRRR